MTEPGKNALGLTGFPTPNEAADTPAYLLFLFNDPTYAQWVLGALEAMAFEYNWYKSGNLETFEASEIFRLIIQQAPYNLLPYEIPAPYWDEDTADDADNEFTRDDQPWYGEIVEASAFVAEDTPSLTFLDNVGIWLIAGFIAYAGKPDAAIAFVPIAKRFVLAFKQSNIGGVVRALIDFAPVAEIDTYGVTDGIASLNIVMPDDDDPHTLYVELTDENPHDLETPSITVLRKRLSEDEFSPAGQRYNVDCDCTQTSPDGGTTWVDNPGIDARHNTAYQLPPRGGDDPQCDAAANATAKLKFEVNVFEQTLSQLQVVNALIAIIDPFFGEVGLFLAVIQAIAEAALAIGSSAISSAFTDDQWDLIQCIVYCHMQPDGTVTADGLAQMLLDIHAQCSTVVYDVMYFTLPSLGEVGLTNAGASGDLTGDCSGCACDHCFKLDLAVADGSAHGLTIQGGTYIPGTGWQGNNYGSGNLSDLFGYWAFPSTIHVLALTLEFYKGGGSGGDNSNNLYSLYPSATSYNATQIAVDASNPTSPDSRLFKTINPLTDLAGIGFDINSGDFPTDIQAYSITVLYSGDEVFGGDNC
jgi:hypothetical protein